MTAEFEGRVTVAKLRIRLEIIFDRGTSGLMYGTKASTSLWVHEVLSHILVSSAISIAKAGDAGKPVLVKRVSHHTRVFSSACERICSDS